MLKWCQSGPKTILHSMVLQQALQNNPLWDVQCPQPFMNIQAVWEKWAHAECAGRVTLTRLLCLLKVYLCI